jgi:hypothetical protein
MSSRSTPTNTNGAGGVERVFAGVVSFVKSCIRLGDYLLGVWCYLFSQAHIVLLGVILASIRLLHAYYTLRVVEKFETLITVGFICQSLHNTKDIFTAFLLIRQAQVGRSTAKYYLHGIGYPVGNPNKEQSLQPCKCRGGNFYQWH